MCCDCGHDFKKGKLVGPEKPIAGRTSLSWGMMFLCLIIPFLGLLLFFAYRRQGKKGAANMAALLGFFNLALAAISGGPQVDIRF